MTSHSRLGGLVLFVSTVGLACPSDVAAQRPAARGGHPNVAVPRAHPVYRPYYRPYAYSPYYRPWYGYPYYSPYYGPYYPRFGFSIGIGYGYGAYGGAFGYPYQYPYPYPSSFPYRYAYPSPYPYYGSTYAAPAPPPERYEPLRTADRRDLGTLSLRVNPPDAAIEIDREAWQRPDGENRFSIDVPEGPHHVVVRKPGYGTYSATVEVRRGEVLTLNVGLTVDAASQAGVRPR